MQAPVDLVGITAAHHLRTGQGYRPRNRNHAGPFVRCMRMLASIYFVDFRPKAVNAWRSKSCPTPMNRRSLSLVSPTAIDTRKLLVSENIPPPDCSISLGSTLYSRIHVMHGFPAN